MMPGYEVKFVNPLRKLHECPVCLYAIKNPVQTECGHRFCRECLDPILKSKRPSCPLDQEEIDPDFIFPDRACRKEILSLEVYCSFMLSGCEWIGPLKNLEAHLPVCEYREIQCTQCGKYIQYLLLATHQEVECPMRPQPCLHCGKDVPAQQLQHHIEKLCPRVLHSCPNDNLEEILENDKTYKQAESLRILNDALKQGYLLLELFACIMIGPPGVGKTLLKHLLLGQKPPLTRTSTLCAEQPIKIRSVSLAKFQSLFGRWKAVSADQLLPMIGRHIRQNVEKRGAIIPDEIKEYLELLVMFSHTPSDTNVAVSSSATASSSADSEDSKVTLNSPSFSSMSSDEEKQSSSSDLDAVKEVITSVFGALEKLISGEELSEVEAEELLRSIWVYITDCGGQPQFHELLPLFIQEVSSVLIVSRLSDKLDDCPPDEFYQDGEIIGKRSCTHLTTENQVQCLTRSLLSHNSSSQPPSIIMVGTHLDLADKCSESIDEKNEKLIKMFGPELREHLIFYKPFKKLLFPVNSLTPGKADYDVAKSIQDGVERSVCKKVKVPIWWFILELLIQGLAKKLEKRVLHRKLCVGLALALGITEEDFDAALKFFDQLNVIKYSPVLPELVFVDSQVPLDNLSDLVQEGYLLRQGQSPSRKGNWMRFCFEGIVTVDFLEGTCKHFEKDIFESPELLKLLQYQLVVVPLKLSKGVMEYFLPALLSILSKEELEKHRVFSSTAAPLLFRFSHGCRRAGVFCCLIVYLIKECGWSILSESGDLMLVARNCVTFWVSSCTCFITLIDAFFYLEAHIAETTPDICQKACPTIQEEVITGINAACSKLKYTNDHPHLAVFCQHPGKTASPAKHEERHAALIRKDCAVCTNGPLTFPLHERHTIWLTESTQGQDDSKTFSPLVSQEIEFGSKLDGRIQLRYLKLIKWTDEGGKTQRFYLMERISPSWRDIGELIDLSAPSLENIATKHRDIALECCRDVLNHWLENPPTGYPITWRGLFELLEDCKLCQVVSELKIVLSKSNLE